MRVCARGPRTHNTSVCGALLLATPPPSPFFLKCQHTLTRAPARPGRPLHESIPAKPFALPQHTPLRHSATLGTPCPFFGVRRQHAHTHTLTVRTVCFPNRVMCFFSLLRQAKQIHKKRPVSLTRACSAWRTRRRAPKSRPPAAAARQTRRRCSSTGRRRARRRR